jgi:hypothetical protein
VLKPTASAQPPLECASLALVSAAAAKAGLKRGKDDPNLVPGVKVLDYTRIVLLPVGSIRAVYVFHHGNGDVIYAICEGVVAKTLDPVLGVCADAGSPAAPDRVKVRAWALRAEAAISTSPKALPVLTSGKRMFVACQNRMFPKSRDPSNAFMINVIVQHSGLPADRNYCTQA